MDLAHSVSNDGDLLFTLKGELDALGSHQVRDTFEQLVEQHSAANVIVDFSQVEFIDSSGIGAIVFLYKTLKSQHRSLSLVRVEGQPLELIKILRIDQVVSVNPKR